MRNTEDREYMFEPVWEVASGVLELCDHVTGGRLVVFTTMKYLLNDNDDAKERVYQQRNPKSSEGIAGDDEHHEAMTTSTTET